MTGNKEVMKRRLKEGRGQFPMDCPINDSRVKIHYRSVSTSTKGFKRRLIDSRLMTTACIVTPLFPSIFGFDLLPGHAVSIGLHNYWSPCWYVAV